jgi:putative endonuclease
MVDRKAIGRNGEQRALAFLKGDGFAILETNYQSKTGEIDIIARKRNLIVFVEVKTRLSARYGYPEEAVDRKKAQRMIKTAKQFLVSKRLYEKTDIRFDVLAVLKKDAGFEIEHFKNAFRDER